MEATDAIVPPPCSARTHGVCLGVAILTAHLYWGSAVSQHPFTSNMNASPGPKIVQLILSLTHKTVTRFRHLVPGAGEIDYWFRDDHP